RSARARDRSADRGDLPRPARPPVGPHAYPRLTRLRLRHDAAEHVERAAERVGRLAELLLILGRDRLAGPVAHPARLLDRVLTELWWSLTVVKTCDFEVGTVVFCSISLWKYPPTIMMPSEWGVTSSRRTSFFSSISAAPWIAAPSATTSSGWTPLHGSRPKNS